LNRCTEIAGQDIDGQKKSQGLTLQDWTMRDKFAGVDTAEQVNEGQCMNSFKYIYTRGFMANCPNIEVDIVSPY